MDPDRARTVFVAGLSGSGKSTATAALEDLGFYCVDNLPAQLVEQFLELCVKATPPIRRVALGVDTREEPFLRLLPEVVASLREQGAGVEVLFLDCSDEVLRTRYSETRRVHPLSPAGSVAEGIDRERRLLEDVARMADVVIDTSALNVHQLKDTVVKRVAGENRSTVVNLLSFGFKHGPPPNADLLFDARFLPNPYFEPTLRKGTGLHADVASYVLDNPRGAEFLGRLTDFIRYLIPLYDAEGKAYVTIGIGCTGGRHRSVALAEAVATAVRDGAREVNVDHRDAGQPL